MRATIPEGSTVEQIDGGWRVVYPEPERLIVNFTPRPDQRDKQAESMFARIAELETQCDQWCNAYAEAKGYEAQREEMFLARIAELTTALRHVQRLAADRAALETIGLDNVLDAIAMLAVDALSDEAQPTATTYEAMAI